MVEFVQKSLPRFQLEVNPEALEDAAKEVTRVENGQRHEEKVERVSQGLSGEHGHRNDIREDASDRDGGLADALYPVRHEDDQLLIGRTQLRAV